MEQNARGCRHHDLVDDSETLGYGHVAAIHNTWISFKLSQQVRNLVFLGMSSSPLYPDTSWAYSHDASFSDPVNSPRMIRVADPRQPIALTRENIQPEGGFEAQLRNAPIGNYNETKIIYAVRHGNTPHNEDSETWGKAVAWRYLSGLAKNFDPQITNEGVSNAITAAQYLSEMVHGQSAPRPLVIYSSPLRRCVETAMHLIKQAGLSYPTPDGRLPPVTLHVKEGLREWMGYGHGHQSDRKGSRADIQALVGHLETELGVAVDYYLDVPEQEYFHDEVYINVDQRVRSVLNDIFNNPNSGDCVMLVLHSRCHKSLLRVLGHPPAAVDNFEMANCAVLPYRVVRRMLDGQEVAAREAYEVQQGQQDQHQAELAKRERAWEAVEDVRAWDNDPSLRYLLESLRELLQFYVGQGDPAAGFALGMLEGDVNPPPG